jgi:serine/threonine protein kinase
MTGRRIELSESLRSLLLNQDNLPQEFEVEGRRYVPHQAVRAGFKAAVWKVTDVYGRPRAAKLAIHEDYESRSFLQELSLAARLEPYSQFAKFIDAGVVRLRLTNDVEQDFVCFIEEWIDGLTLEQFLVDHRSAINSAFIVGYVESMCGALAALAAEGLRHDDLHPGNVMLARPPRGSLNDGWTVRVIDMGSLKPAETPLAKSKDDHQNLVDHLVAIHNAGCAKKLLAQREKQFLRDMIGLMMSMLDDDRAVALRAPDQIKAQFDLAFSRAARARHTRIPSLNSPFEYISAEHIADDRLLVQIFASSCPWLEKVAGPDPCLVTGPRGCGKSTIFRWLSLRAHLHKPATELDALRIAGFYISCSSDLQNRLGWIRTPDLAERFRKEVVHYFNLLIAREIVQTLCVIEERDDAALYWGLGVSQSQEIYAFLRNALQLSQPHIQGVSRLRQCLDLLESDMFRCHVQVLRGLNLDWTTPETFLGDLTSLLAREIRYFAERRITILLDDFSTHRLPEPVQVVLNRVIWERRDSHIFKLSSEKYGAPLSDSFQATIDITREMLEIDCGREYVALDDHDQLAKARAFATDLLANRLMAAGYRGSPEMLLGHSHWPQGSLARALRDKSPGRTGDQYHGMECIADLCSGDISTLLLVYRRVFERGNVTSASIAAVPSRVQHDAIESVARELYESIRHHFPHGPTMYVIAREFGTLVRNVLETGRLLKKANDRVPPQCPRIEVDQASPGADEGLTEDLAELARELVRRAVFIEMEPGRSRHKFVTTLRWQLRRVYLPAFGAALSKNTAVKWSPSEFKYFLTDPRGACAVEWNKQQKEATTKDMTTDAPRQETIEFPRPSSG